MYLRRASQAAVNYNIRKYSFAGAAGTIIARNSFIYGLSVDPAGNIYAGGVGTASGGDGGLRKYNSGGTLQWDKNHGATIYAVAANATDVCMGGGRATSIDSKTTRKYTASGTLSWSADHGDYVLAIAMDAAGNVYTAASSPAVLRLASTTVVEPSNGRPTTAPRSMALLLMRLEMCTHAGLRMDRTRSENITHPAHCNGRQTRGIRIGLFAWIQMVMFMCVGLAISKNLMPAERKSPLAAFQSHH